MVLSQFRLGEIKPIIPSFFNLTLVYNPGVAFGVFSDLSDAVRIAVLTATTGIALLAIGYFLFSQYRHDIIAQAALAMITGGAIGNIIDRVRLGEVVDFLDFFIANYHWPAFNIADSAICVGVCILLFRTPADQESGEEELIQKEKELERSSNAS